MALRRFSNAIFNWEDVLTELAWRFSTNEAQANESPSWEVPQGFCERLVINWPASYASPDAGHWLQHLHKGFQRKTRVKSTDLIEQYPGENVVAADFQIDDKLHRVIFDFSDYMDRICKPALIASTLYFKMQFYEGGYGNDKILPGGYPVSSPYSYMFLSKLRRSCDALAKLYNVYGRFGLRFSAEIRSKAISLLSSATELKYEGGTRFVRNSRYLRDMARTKIGIDMPGNGDFCFRLIDYLSIGVCVIGPRPRTTLPVPLSDRENIVYCKDDLSDLVSLCSYYLAHDNERNRIALNARDYFDCYLHRDQLVGYFISSLANRISRL